MNSIKKKIRFIINPRSGIGRQKKVEVLISKHLDKSQFEYEVCYTNAKEHAVTLSREAAEQGFDAVITVGGDGSVNETARGVVYTGTALGIIPAGSGNGLAHYMKIPLNTRNAIQKINNFNLETIDTGSINGRLFVSIAGVGFDAHVAKLFSSSRLRGFWSYAKFIFLEYITYNPKRFKIYVDGKVLKKNAFMLSFANSDQFGFNARIAATAKIDDGLIDFCIVRKPRIYYVLLLVPFFFLGWLHKTPFVKIIQTKEIKVIQAKNNIAHIDGDEIDLGKSIEVKINPRSLKVIC